LIEIYTRNIAVLTFTAS